MENRCISIIYNPTLRIKMNNTLTNDIDDFLRDAMWGHRQNEYDNRMANILSCINGITSSLASQREEVIETRYEYLRGIIECRCRTERNRNKNLDHIIEGYRSMYRRIQVFHISNIANTHRQMRHVMDIDPLPCMCIALKEKENSITCIALWK